MIFTYNKIVKNKNQVGFSYNNIDIQLKKRYETLPNIIATTKKYLEHENDLFTKISSIRSAYSDGPLKGRLDREKDIGSWLNSVNLTVENYPDLKGIEAIVLLQRTINELAEQISASQRAYNASVLSYNNSISVFPNNLVASLFGYKKEGYLEVSSLEIDNPSMTGL